MSINSLVGLVPALGVVAKITGVSIFDRPKWSHVERLLAMAEKAEGDARAELMSLAGAHVRVLAAKDRAVLHRKVDGGTVAALIFVAVVAGLGIWGLLSLHHFLADVGAGLLALCALALIGVGFTDLYKTDEASESHSTADA